tara:strand:- start:480 stop:689 length:210 start_codon:yes stop_codon:yes gene_type:complete
MEKLLDRINETAINYQKTGDEKYKKLWYKLIKEFANNGLNTSERRVVSISSCHKGDDGGYIITGKSRLL